MNDGVALPQRGVGVGLASAGKPQTGASRPDPVRPNRDQVPQLAKQSDPVPRRQPKARQVVDGAPNTAIVARPRGQWVSAFCAVVAIVAACISLAAPWLRPQVDTRAQQLLGQNNVVSRLVIGVPPITPAQVHAEAVAVAEDTLRANLAVYDQRIQAMSEAMQATRKDLTDAVVALRASTAGNAALSAAVDGLNQRADRLQSAGTALEARARAANVLALAVGLRRNIDAGVPIDLECAALKATGVFPDPVDHALQDLTRLAPGIPTMRDLGDGFDQVDAQLTARIESSLISRSWLRVQSLLGVSSQPSDEALLARLRALVADGRFSAAANALDASDAASVGARWVAQVRARTTAVIATQVVLAHALQATEAAYAANDDAPARKPTP
jgi:hypothetical protein